MLFYKYSIKSTKSDLVTLNTMLNPFNGRNDNTANNQSSILPRHTCYSLQQIAII
jgi:hypothetical protein